MFRHRNIVRRRIFVRRNGESSSKIDFVNERSRVKTNMHREMMGDRRIIDSSKNGLPLEWQVVVVPPFRGNANSSWLPRFHLHAE